MNTMQKLIRVKRITNKNDLLILQEVRAQVYARAGKNTPNVQDDFELLNQENFYILAFYQDEKVIGSITIYLPETSFIWLPQARYKKIPSPHKSIEVAKLFIVPEHRGFLLLLKIFQEVHKILRLSLRQFIVIRCDSHLKKLYQRMNFRQTGITFYKNQISKVSQLEIMIANHKQFGIYGLLDGPFNWNLFMKPVIDELRSSGELQLTYLEKLNYFLYSFFEKITLKKIKVLYGIK